jgi:hypothetical protein
MVKNMQESNMFELNGGNIQITYSSTSVKGSQLFSYRDSSINRSFSGKEIHSQETDIGELLTIIIKQVSDLQSVSFTLILPNVFVEPKSAGTEIETVGLTTITHSNIVSSALSQGKIYTPVSLKGRVQHGLS